MLVNIKVGVLMALILCLNSIAWSSVKQMYVPKATQEGIRIKTQGDTVKYDVIGKVIGKDGLPIPFVSVSIEGTSNKTTTDVEGVFCIRADQNDFLSVDVIGMKPQRVCVISNRIDIILEEIEFKDESGPPNPPINKHDQRFMSATHVTAKDIENADNPNYQFIKNANKNIFVIFVSELSVYEFNREDLEFQKKYNVIYSMTGNCAVEYLQKYNKLTYKHLNKIFRKSWHETIRRDAIGLDTYLK